MFYVTQKTIKRAKQHSTHIVIVYSSLRNINNVVQVLLLQKSDIQIYL